MPLFTFECKTCFKIIEKFLKEEKIKFRCECGSEELERKFGFCMQSRIWRGAQEYMDGVINPEIDHLQKKLSRGDDSVFADIAGEE